MKLKKLLAGLSIVISATMIACSGSKTEEVFVDITSEINDEIDLPEGMDGLELTPDIIEDVPQEEIIEEVVEEKPEVTEGQTPFEIHGKLTLNGTNIVDQNGQNFQLCGISTHGLAWFPEYVNKDSFRSLRDDFGANVVRLALYTDEGGYCTGGNKENLKKVVTDGTDYATDLGMYVIIDWHILHDLDPNVYKEDAKVFFDEMSLRYANNDNVIYEICNEPNGGTSWSSVKSYAEEIIPIIRKNDPDAIIIVGTPNWSQDVDDAAKNPITGYDNIMYAVHFYADTHKEWLRDKVDVALKKGLPVFISEFSICDASGNGNNNVGEADKWIKYLDKNNISFVAWNLSNKNESSSLISAGCQKKSGWDYNDLSESGKWLVNVLNSHSDQGSGLMNNQGIASVPKQDAEKQDNNVSDNNNQTSSESVGAKNGNLEVNVAASNSWESGDETFTQYTITLKNSGNGDVSGWTLELEFDKEIQIDQIWCSHGTVNGKKIVVEPESYNGIIGGGQSTSDVGLIVKSNGNANCVSVKSR